MYGRKSVSEIILQAKTENSITYTIDEGGTISRSIPEQFEVKNGVSDYPYKVLAASKLEPEQPNESLSFQVRVRHGAAMKETWLPWSADIGVSFGPVSVGTDIGQFFNDDKETGLFYFGAEIRKKYVE